MDHFQVNSRVFFDSNFEAMLLQAKYFPQYSENVLAEVSNTNIVSYYGFFSEKMASWDPFEGVDPFAESANSLSDAAFGNDDPFGENAFINQFDQPTGKVIFSFLFCFCFCFSFPHIFLVARN